MSQLKEFLKIVLTGTRQGGGESAEKLYRLAAAGMVLSIPMLVIVGVAETRLSEIEMNLTIPFLKLLMLAVTIEDVIFKLVPYIIIYLLSSWAKPGFKQRLYLRAVLILPLISATVHLTNMYSVGWPAIPYFMIHFGTGVALAHLLVKYGIITCWWVHYLYDVCVITIGVIKGVL